MVQSHDSQDLDALLHLGVTLGGALANHNAEAAVGYCQLAISSICIKSTPPVNDAMWSAFEKHVVGVHQWVCAIRFKQTKTIMGMHRICRLDVVHEADGFALLGCEFQTDPRWIDRSGKIGFPILDEASERTSRKVIVPLWPTAPETATEVAGIMWRDGDYVDSKGVAFSADGRKSTNLYGSFLELHLGDKRFFRRRGWFWSKFRF